MSAAQLRVYEQIYSCPQQTMVRWKASTVLFAQSVPLRHRSRVQHRNVTQTVLCFRTCIDTPCNPKRSPLSEMTCPASSTAVCSLLPVPKRMPSNSALESASGPSDNSRSRGLSSRGSCFIVYLRPSTVVFYIIRTFRTLNDSYVGGSLTALHVVETGLGMDSRRVAL